MLGLWRIITMFITVKPARPWMILVSIAWRDWGKNLAFRLITIYVLSRHYSKTC
jgi:hypothetical protein